ncbi:type II toxin-antitoxin system RelE/ParE family toxin [Acidithiobacillus sp. IBUN Pt1247-S3]|uniref:type II toxin-antitoxin system RelE/ParE family toxin n=1 Tax=Acidithiobacillus sp. IBUN Pt1247-S3 TaxID=3166642 RepID=UPI0034E59F03
MIQGFRHKGLQKFYETGSKAGIMAEHEKRLRVLLARLDAAKEPADMDLPGTRLHALKGDMAEFWAVSVSGNWRLIFRFVGSDAVAVDYLDYH